MDKTLAERLREIADTHEGTFSDSCAAPLREAARALDRITPPDAGVGLTRWDVGQDRFAVQHPEGEWVRHEDAAAALADEKARADRLNAEWEDKFSRAHEQAVAERAAAEALQAVSPYIDTIVCYASTISEHDGNLVAALAEAALATIPAKPETQP